MRAKAEKQVKRGVVGLVAWSFMASAFAFWCVPPYEESWVLPMFNNANKILIGAIKEMDAALSGQLYWQSERLTSAIAVLTKQKALAANQISDGVRNSNQEVALGLNALAQAERVKKARFDFGGEFGQGFSPCYVADGRLLITRTESDLSGELADAVRSGVRASPGRYEDPVLAQKQMLAEHGKLFCTEDQAKSGLCERVGKLPGASLSIATLFKPSGNSEDLSKAKDALINNLAGLPDAPVPVTGAGSEATAAYQLAKMERDAMRSTALASLKQIQQESSSTDGDSEALPLTMQYSTEVKRYAGNTPEYQSWARVMAAQNDRGVLVELLKIKALDLALQERQFRQWERVEVQLASLTSSSLKADPVAVSSEAGDSAIRKNAAQQVGK